MQETQRLLSCVCEIGQTLIASGAEVYRVEDTMVRLIRSFHMVEKAEAFVTLTGLMVSIWVEGQTYTQIARIHARSTNLAMIDQINALSRQACSQPISVDELQEAFQKIKGHRPYDLSHRLLAGALGAAGFSLFFGGSWPDFGICFGIGILCTWLTTYLMSIKLHLFVTNLLASALVALLAGMANILYEPISVNIVVISSIMLLVPGLPLTNAIRDTIAGDYLSALARMMEAFVVAAAIALGAGLMMYAGVTLWSWM